MRIAVATLGCRLNQYDTASLEEHLKVFKPEFVELGAPADFCIINTCTVTNRADREARQLIRRAKKANPKGHVIVTGCYAQVNPDELARTNGVDLVAGIGQASGILDYITRQARTANHVLWSDLRTEKGVGLFGGHRIRGRTRVFLKVQEGCNFSCTFCIIPTARGKSRSVPPERVLAEIRRLVEEGVQEIVLTGIHLGSYGHDLDPRIQLVDLLERIERQGCRFRLRLSSLDPREVSLHLIELMAQSEIVCPSLHICAQSGENAVLKRMRRNYSAGMYRDLIHMVREKLPDASLGTDVIVGFPAEGEEEFVKSLVFFGSLPLSYFHVFPYSIRRGTAAATYEGQVPEVTKKERSRRMREVGLEKSARFARQFLGRTTEVLTESTGPKVIGSDQDRNPKWVAGYARNYLPVRVDLTSLPLPVRCGCTNRIQDVEIYGTAGRWALARLV